MQPKKNPKVDLNKNSSLYFAIGLALVLFIIWRGIEWKSYDKSAYLYESLNVVDDDDEEIPITEQIKTPPPPPPLSCSSLLSSILLIPPLCSSLLLAPPLHLSIYPFSQE